MTDTPIQTPQSAHAGFRLPLGRRGLGLLAMALIGAGATLNWGWLTAIGAAPLILAVAPCAVMCGLGLCMMGGAKGCAADKTPTGSSGAMRD